MSASQHERNIIKNLIFGPNFGLKVNNELFLFLDFNHSGVFFTFPPLDKRGDVSMEPSNIVFIFLGVRIYFLGNTLDLWFYLRLNFLNFVLDFWDYNLFDIFDIFGQVFEFDKLLDYFVLVYWLFKEELFHVFFWLSWRFVVRCHDSTGFFSWYFPAEILISFLLGKPTLCILFRKYQLLLWLLLFLWQRLKLNFSYFTAQFDALIWNSLHLVRRQSTFSGLFLALGICCFFITVHWLRAYTIDF